MTSVFLAVLSRRDWLRHAAVLIPGMAAAAPAGGLIEKISRTTVFRYAETGKAWFHPRACRIPKAGGGRLLMTLQRITGSDVFHHVHWTESFDLGANWSDPQPIPGMGRKPGIDGLDEGICDVVPEYHPKTQTVIAMGHNVYYDKTGKLTRPGNDRWPVYSVRSRDGQWGPAKRLFWDDPDADAIYSSGCSQRITLANGDVLVPLTFGSVRRKDRAVCSVRCTFDGRELRIVEKGNVHHDAVGRGLLEPSLALHHGRYFMTIRAEDQRGYVAASMDGLHWEEKKAWAWDDGEPLTLSTTQQRWLPHSDGLLLTYTRKDASNEKVMRWRTPIYVAQVDPERLCLIRSTEQIVFPLVGDAVHDPKGVRLHGNFHTTAISRKESIVTSCDLLVRDFSGDTMQARIRWSRPNREIAG